MNCKAIVFDLDGTLLDTLEDLKNAVNAALESEGMPTRTLEEVRGFVGNGISLLLRRAAGRTLDDNLFDRINKAFSAHYEAHLCDRTRPYPGIPVLLDALKKEGCRLAVVSNKRDGAVQTLCSFFFPGVFDAVAGERPGLPRKPDRALVDLVLREMNVKSGECLYVGDSGVDIETAKNAGLDALFVTWGFRSREFLLSNGAERLVDDPCEILKLYKEGSGQ